MFGVRARRFVPDSALEQSGFEPLVPRLQAELGASGGARRDDAAPAPAAPADIAVKVAEIRFSARGVGPGRPGAGGSVPRLLMSGCRPRTLVPRSRVCRPDRWRHQMWIARPRLLRVASWNASVRVGWAWMVPATSSRSAPISIANVNSPMSSATWAPTAWTPSTR